MGQICEKKWRKNRELSLFVKKNFVLRHLFWAKASCFREATRISHSGFLAGDKVPGFVMIRRCVREGRWKRPATVSKSQLHHFDTQTFYFALNQAGYPMLGDVNLIH